MKTMILSCACCSGEAKSIRQWWNRDAGYGVCPACFRKCVKKDGSKQAVLLYGVAGIHHSIEEPKPRQVTEWLEPLEFVRMNGSDHGMCARDWLEVEKNRIAQRGWNMVIKQHKKENKIALFRIQSLPH